MCALMALRSRQPPWPAETPKRVTFTASVWNEFDDDGLAAAIKPYRDACRSMRLIHDDRPSAGHQFVYTQCVARGPRAARGVTVHVELLTAGTTLT
jgi:hypothetical protein